MAFDLTLPLFAAFGVALGALVTYLGWPHVRLRTYNKTLGNLRVIEIALILSPPAKQAAGSARRPVSGNGTGGATEFVIYMTLKTGNL
jgi:hypothetical protein